MRMEWRGSGGGIAVSSEQSSPASTKRKKNEPGATVRVYVFRVGRGMESREPER